MLSKSTSTIYFLLSLLIAVMLSSGIARAEVNSSSASHHITTTDIISFGHCGLDMDKTNEPGCCDPGGSCIKKQCCSHPGQASGAAVVGTQQRSYEAPFRYGLVATLTIDYTSADIHTLYRPPIA